MAKKKSKYKSSNHYLKYTGMVFQLFVLLAILLYIGQCLDERLANQKAYFTAFLPVFGLMAYFYKIYIDVMQE